MASPDESAGSDAKNGDENIPRLLLVEDDYLVATALEEGLVDAGFRIVGSVGTAEEAIALAKAEKPNLAIMDIRLRGARDGVEAAVEIYRASGVRSIFATAHYDALTRARAEPAAPLGWLPKPYSVESLVAMIRSALGSQDDALTNED